MSLRRSPRLTPKYGHISSNAAIDARTLSCRPLVRHARNHVRRSVANAAFLTRLLIVVTLAPTTRAIGIDPNNAGAYSNRGNAYSALGNFAKALADYDRAIVINPGDANAYRNRASARESLDNIFQAQADMQKYRDISGAI